MKPASDELIARMEASANHNKANELIMGAVMPDVILALIARIRQQDEQIKSLTIKLETLALKANPHGKGEDR